MLIAWFAHQTRQVAAGTAHAILRLGHSYSAILHPSSTVNAPSKVG
jgi:hypothetical protein